MSPDPQPPFPSVQGAWGSEVSPRKQKARRLGRRANAGFLETGSIRRASRVKPGLRQLPSSCSSLSPLPPDRFHGRWHAARLLLDRTGRAIITDGRGPLAQGRGSGPSESCPRPASLPPSLPRGPARGAVRLTAARTAAPVCCSPLPCPARVQDAPALLCSTSTGILLARGQ